MKSVSEIVERAKKAKPEHLKRVQVRLQRSMTAAEVFVGGDGCPLPKWKEAIDRLPEKPDLLLDCNGILADMVDHGLDDEEEKEASHG
jgi:hypothetical protein